MVNEQKKSRKRLRLTNLFKGLQMFFHRKKPKYQEFLLTLQDISILQT